MKWLIDCPSSVKTFFEDPLVFHGRGSVRLGKLDSFELFLLSLLLLNLVMKLLLILWLLKWLQMFGVKSLVT